MTRKIDPYPIPTNCLYCQSDVVFTNNAIIYGKTYGNGKCYTCTKCDAYVGVHNGTNIPLGRLANKELRELKKQAHVLFDPIWQTKQKTRSEAYRDLAKALGIPKKECHFGWFNRDLLLQAIALLQPSIEPKRLLLEIITLLKQDLRGIHQEDVAYLRLAMQKVREKKPFTCLEVQDMQVLHTKILHHAHKKHTP